MATRAQKALWGSPAILAVLAALLLHLPASSAPAVEGEERDPLLPLPAAPLSEPETAKVKAWIADLGSEQFTKRQAAEEELIRFGERAWALLEPCLKSDDPEVQTRARSVVERLGVIPPSQRADAERFARQLKDKDANVTLLSWTGNYAPRQSPFGFGQLVLLQPAK